MKIPDDLVVGRLVIREHEDKGICFSQIVLGMAKEQVVKLWAI